MRLQHCGAEWVMKLFDDETDEESFGENSIMMVASFLLKGGSFNTQFHAKFFASCTKVVKTLMVRGSREWIVVTDEK